jgi:hypothetical protein
MGKIILSIIMCYCLVYLYLVNIFDSLCVKFPDGTWTSTAINPKINGNLLCAELKNIKGNYESSCIIFNQNDKYSNIDGKIAKSSDTIPDGVWLSSENYKKNSVHFNNGRLCAKLYTYESPFKEHCIDVAEGDKVGISNWSGFYTYQEN